MVLELVMILWRMNKMKIANERKLVTMEVTNDEMRVIEDIEYANVGQFGDTTIDLDTYAEYVEDDNEMIEIAIKELADKNVEADVIQFVTI